MSHIFYPLVFSTMTNDILDDFSEEMKPKTPTGLVVLSILSFIWNGIMLTGIAFSWFNNPGANVNIAFVIGKLIGVLLVSSICIVSIIGTIKMLKMKRTGYFMFLIPQIIYIVIFSVAAYSVFHISVNQVMSEQMKIMLYLYLGILSFLVVLTILFSLYFNKFKRKIT